MVFEMAKKNGTMSRILPTSIVVVLAGYLLLLLLWLFEIDIRPSTVLV
jgi:p-aminobenzoyl-glutamate transporter AbgT